MAKGSKESEVLKVYLRADGEIAERLMKIREHLGLKNYTEVIRALINDYWREHEEEIRKSLKSSRKG